MSTTHSLAFEIPGASFEVQRLAFQETTWFAIDEQTFVTMKRDRLNATASFVAPRLQCNMLGFRTVGVAAVVLDLFRAAHALAVAMSSGTEGHFSLNGQHIADVLINRPDILTVFADEFEDR